MTPAECREAVRLMFAELYPHCTVIYSYPNSVRPPLPYVVLDFERIEPVNAFEYVKNGILWQEKCKRIPFSAELVTESKTEHAAGVKKLACQRSWTTLNKLFSSLIANTQVTKCAP